jgi:hypothetical protein
MKKMKERLVMVWIDTLLVKKLKNKKHFLYIYIYIPILKRVAQWVR